MINVYKYYLSIQKYCKYNFVHAYQRINIKKLFIKFILYCPVGLHVYAFEQEKCVYNEYISDFFNIWK